MKYAVHKFNSYDDIAGIWDYFKQSDRTDSSITLITDDEAYFVCGGVEIEDYAYAVKTELPIYRLDTKHPSQPFYINLDNFAVAGKIKNRVGLTTDSTRFNVMMAKHVEEIISKYTKVSRRGFFLFDEDGCQISTCFSENINGSMQYFFILYLNKPNGSENVTIDICYKSNIGGLGLSKKDEELLIKEIYSSSPFSFSGIENERMNKEECELFAEEIKQFSSSYHPVSKGAVQQ